MTLETALRDARLTPTELDARGLMPLERARATLAETTAVTRDNLDIVWAAMLSLEHGAELAAASAHLDWQLPPRGRDNIALAQRYGADLVPWLATRARGGVLVNHPWCVIPCIRAIADAAALELLLKVGGVDSDGGKMTAWVFERDGAHPEQAALEQAALELVLEWTRLHFDTAFPVLVRHARSSARAAAALMALATKRPHEVKRRLAALGETTLAADLALPEHQSVDAILADLDAASRRSWPLLVTGVDGRMEFFGMRVIAAAGPAPDTWGLIFERLQGCGPDSFSVARWAYGPTTVNGWDFGMTVSLYDAISFEEERTFSGTTMTGPAGPLTLDESLFARHDLRPGFDTECGGWPEHTLAVRAYLAEHPGCFWPAPADSLAAANLQGAELLVIATDYQHPSASVMEPEDAPWRLMPSASPVIRSLVEAVLARDPSRFAPGESNTDWRIHAREPNDMVPPWKTHRVDLSSGFLAAAMEEAGVTLDDRGLMPLETARELVKAPSLARGAGRMIDDTWVWDRDLVWAALLSLADADEAGAALARTKIGIGQGPRDPSQNKALVERYGDLALTVIGACRGEGGVIEAPSPFFRVTVLSIASPAGFRFVWDIPGWRESDEPPDTQATALFTAWVTAHPETGYVELGRLALAGDAAGLAFLSAWAAPQARRVYAWLCAGLGEARAQDLYTRAGLAWTLAPSHVLSCLDYYAAQGVDHWPVFRTGAGPSREYHGMRLIAARSGDQWAIILERFEGYAQYLSVQRYVYSEVLPSGRRTDLAVKIALGDWNDALPAEETLIEPPDYWTRYDRPQRPIAVARAMLESAPEAVWPEPSSLLEAIGLKNAETIVSTDFAFTQGPKFGDPLPSQSPTFQSLAEAIASGDPTRFVRGPSNLFHRAHIPST